jgi:mercuric ion binding protein
MKNLIITVSIITLSIGAWAQPKKASTVELQTIQIKTSVVCDMCKETLEKAMAYEKGVKSSNLDVASKILTVTYDPKKTTSDKIKLAVTKTGYDADEMLADVKAYDNLNMCCKKDAKH